MGKARKAGRNRKAAVKIEQSPWDHGSSGQANQRDLINEKRGDIDPETGKVINPNGVSGSRRRDMLEIYHKRGWISTRGYNAGELLRVAWLRTEIGTCAPWLRERVDSSPKPDAAINIQIDRMSALIRISKMVEPDDENIIDCVCYRGVGVGQLQEYRGRHHEEGKRHLFNALENLANRMEGLARKFKVV